MLIDSSAFVEILPLAPQRQDMFDRIDHAGTRLVTSATAIYETTLVLSRKTGKNVSIVRDFVLEFLDDLDMEIAVIDRSTAIAALDAFARYSKGRHPAKLNFGDCFSYAGAKAAGLPLLYVGNDFAQTDLA
jgi:Uncharacterized protein conserved in bacteria